MNLQDKVILITGSTTGIGEAIARRCVAEGARVIVHGRDQKRGESLVAELGTTAVLHIDDLADPDAPQRLVDAAVGAFGRLDGVVNNAAWVKRSRIEDTDAALFDQIMAINVRAPLLTVRAALPHLRDTRGCVINIGSINAYSGEQNLLAYSVSKGALQTLSMNLADALGTAGIRFTHLNVGWVLTENEYQYKIDDGLPKNWPETLGPENIPSGAMTQPDQIAAVVAFWLSENARPFSGSVIELEQFPFVGRNPTKEEKS